MPKKLQDLIAPDLFSEAEKVLGSSAEVERWFHSNLKALGGKTPYEVYLVKPEEISDLLGRIEHGVYS
jgi:uncharacterized protein (DUF2384 family)